MIERIQQELDRFETAEKPFLLAVSGGVDSMVLWDLIRRLKIQHEVAHVNFKLREEESEADQHLVKNSADRFGIQFHLLEKNAKEYASKNQVSTQMAAREIRYDFFDSLRLNGNLGPLLTAHHLDDQIETFFLNLDRGTGINGLLGIKSTTDLLRPLKNISKEEILAYAAKNKVEFRTDRSNQNKDYQRNWIRHELIKPWKERNQQFVTIMKKNMMLLSQQADSLNKKSKPLLELLNAYFKAGFIPYSILNKEDLDQVNLKLFLFQIGLQAEQFERFAQAVVSQSVGKRFYLSEYVLNLDRKGVFCEKINEADEKIDYSFELSELLECKFKEFNFTQEPVEKPIEFKMNQHYLSLDKLTFPIQIRRWRAGDRFKPLGLNGSKKVSDYLIDKKVPLSKKQEVMIMCSKDQIIAILGHQIDERYKLKPSDTNMLRISW